MGISIHALCEEGDAGRPTNLITRQQISIHALREEGDHSSFIRYFTDFYFYPRPPRGGRRVASSPSGKQFLFLSTPSARRATEGFELVSQAQGISIHALREEGDSVKSTFSSLEKEFLSTPSARRATLCPTLRSLRPKNFYPRPPRGGRLFGFPRRNETIVFLSTPSARRATCCHVHPPFYQGISIHALREEGDGSLMVTMPFLMRFLSTPSARRATYACPKPVKLSRYFYPRPPRGGRPSESLRQIRETNFYPRPPRGGRLGNLKYSITFEQFLSTPSARRATTSWATKRRTHIFLSTPSARRATLQLHDHRPHHDISIHALREEGDDFCRMISAK